MGHSCFINLLSLHHLFLAISKYQFIASINVHFCYQTPLTSAPELLSCKRADITTRLKILTQEVCRPTAISLTYNFFFVPTVIYAEEISEALIVTYVYIHFV